MRKVSNKKLYWLLLVGCIGVFALVVFLTSCSFKDEIKEKYPDVLTGLVFEEEVQTKYFVLAPEDSVVAFCINKKKGISRISASTLLQNCFTAEIEGDCTATFDIKTGHINCLNTFGDREINIRFASREVIEFIKALGEPWEEFEVHPGIPAPVYE